MENILVDTTELSEDDLSEIVSCIEEVKADYFKIGVALGLNHNTVEGIKKEKLDHAESLIKVINEWLLKNYNWKKHGKPTWKALVEAVQKPIGGNNTELAIRIATDHPAGNRNAADASASGHVLASQRSESTSSGASVFSPTSVASPGLSLPASIPLVNSLSSPDSSPLESDVEEDLKQQLDSYSNEIETQYAYYVDCIRGIVESKGISPGQLSSFLINLPASNSDRRKKSKLLSHVKDELKKATKISDIFILLSEKCASFLDFDIFKTILQRYGFTEKQEELEYSSRLQEYLEYPSRLQEYLEYPSRLQEYLEKLKIKEFIKNHPDLLNHKLEALCNDSKIHVKLDIEETCNLSTIQEVKRAVANILGLKSSALRLCRVSKGCVLVTLLISKLTAEAIFTSNVIFTWQDICQFQEAKVMWLKCNGYKFDFRDGDDVFLFVAKKNFAMIQSEYTKLMPEITRNLSAINPDMDEIHQYITSLFEAKIQRENNIQSMLTTLSEKKCWNYFDLSNLERIVEMFSGDREDKNMELINAYKKQLAGYKTATRIVDYIKESKRHVNDLNDEEDNLEEQSKLLVKLVKGDRRDKITISLESLLYIEKLWNSICLELHVPLLPKLLDYSIVEGSIHIHWLIHHVFVWKILEQIGDAKEFLEQESIVSLSLEDVCIYNQEKGGVVNQRILQYVMLLLLTQERNEDKMEEFLQNYFSDINAAISENGQTILLFAAQHGHKVMMEPLLNHGADLYCTDRNGTSILSTSKPHQDLHEWIQDKCEDALITAAGKPDLATVRKSLEIGVNPDAKEKDKYGWTALMWASEKGHADIAFYLVDQKADVNAHDFAHWTSLILSSRRGYLSIVRKLLDGGADVNKQTQSLWSALMWTAQLGHTDIARLLLERGADPHMRDEAGFTPFLQASQDGNIDIVRLLVEREKEFDVNQVTNTGWSAAMLATKNGHEKLLEYLIEQKCDIHYQREKDEITALHIASFKDNNNIVRRLCIQQKLEVNVQDCDGVTPLMYAAKKGLVQVTKTLVQNGHADVNIAENDNEWTALFFAMEGRHNDLLDYLLSTKKVNLNHRDKWGHTIVDIAKLMNPDALDHFKKHYKTEMDAILSKPAIAPVNLKKYQTMLERFSFKFSATPKGLVMAGAA